MVEQSLNNYLKKTISIWDTFVKKQMKENFYHGFYLEFSDFSRTGVCHQIKNRVMDTVIF